MLLRHRGVSVACDQCRDRPARAGIARWWPSSAAALDAVTALGWYVLDGGARVWCPSCGPVLVCQAEGHDFGQWRACVCCVGVAYRECAQCGLIEFRPGIPAGLSEVVA